MKSSPFTRITKSNKEIHLIPKSNNYQYIFIFIHGLFGSPLNFVDIFDKFDGPIPDSFKIILPCAPIQNADFNNGNPTTSWFNISKKYDGVILEDTIDYNELEKSSQFIKNIINEEVKLLNDDYSKIFLSGYSQGACLSFHIGLSFDFLLGGIICFCGMPFSYTKVNENNKKNLNIFTVLGFKDENFQIKYVLEQIKNLIGDNSNLIVKEYPNNAHKVCDDELEDMKKFILNIIEKK